MAGHRTLSMPRHETRSTRPRTPETADLLLMRIRGEYLEMPGLRLTPAQARRLWGLDPAQCQRLLDALVGTRFLRRTADGSYQRES